jgi:hypothetical protein
MKRTMMLLLVFAALGLILAGCKKKEAPPPAEPAAEPAAKTEEPAKEEPAAEPKEEAKTEEAKAEPAAAGDPEKDCGALHDFMKGMIEAMTKKLGKGAKPKKEFPSREKFITACKELPSDVVRCMNPQVAMAEQAKCKEVLEKADKAAVAKFKEILK